MWYIATYIKPKQYLHAHMAYDKKQVVLKLDPEAKNNLDYLAKKDRRYLSGVVEFLIAEEMARRGVTPSSNASRSIP